MIIPSTGQLANTLRMTPEYGGIVTWTGDDMLSESVCSSPVSSSLALVSHSSIPKYSKAWGGMFILVSYSVSEKLTATITRA